ncbi:MAG: AAA family ATPase [Candidatus Eisenbacteria bacterium]
MKLIRLRADGFGPLRGEWHFSPDRLNLVVEANERGKSTLLAAVAAALYGLEDDRRSHRVVTPRERFRPWSGGSFGVELDLEVAGERYRIARDFEKATVLVTNSRGEDVTHSFLEDREDYPVGRKLLGVDSVEFEKCAFVRQGDLDQVVPGDEKARRASTLRARLENAADTHIGDTNASEAMRVLEEALRRYTAPELEFTGTVDTAIDRLDAKRGMIEADLHALEHELGRAQEPLERLAQLGEEEERIKNHLRELDGERHAVHADEIRRQLEEHDAARAELQRLEAEAESLRAAAQLPASAESDLRETIARHDEALRSLEALETRRREELAKERSVIETELKGARSYDGYAAQEADACLSVAADLRRVALDDQQLRHEVFVLRDALAALGHEPERIQFLTARFGGLPEENVRLLREHSQVHLAFQTEVAGLEQERTEATEALRAVDTARSARKVPGWFLLALGLGGALAGAVVYAMQGAPLVWMSLFGVGVMLVGAGIMLLSIGGRSQAVERDVALRKLADAQQRLNHLRTHRAKNEVHLAELSRLMGYRDSVDVMRHWNEYSRLVDDSGPLLRAQEQLSQIESRRRTVTGIAKPLLRALGEVEPTPELLEKVAYEARRYLHARDRIAGLEKSFDWVEEEKRVVQATAAGLHEKALRILQAAGLVHDPTRPWQEHVEELATRVRHRHRFNVIHEELVPYAKQRVLPDIEVDQRRQQLSLLAAGHVAGVSPRPAVEIEMDSKQTRTRLEEVQRERSDLRLQAEEVWRRYNQMKPEHEATAARLGAARARAQRFKQSVELARAGIQKVAKDTH